MTRKNTALAALLTSAALLVAGCSLGGGSDTETRYPVAPMPTWSKGSNVFTPGKPAQKINGADRPKDAPPRLDGFTTGEDGYQHQIALGTTPLPYKAGYASTVKGDSANVKQYAADVLKVNDRLWRQHLKSTKLVIPSFNAAYVTASLNYRVPCPIFDDSDTGQGRVSGFTTITSDGPAFFCDGSDTNGEIVLPAKTLESLWKNHNAKTASMAAGIVISRISAEKLMRAMVNQLDWDFNRSGDVASCMAGVIAHGVYPQNAGQANEALEIAASFPIGLYGKSWNTTLDAKSWRLGFETGKFSTCQTQIWQSS